LYFGAKPNSFFAFSIESDVSFGPLIGSYLARGESRLNKLLIRLSHTSILRGNQTLMVALQPALQRLRKRLPTITYINISAAIPAPRHGVLLPAFEIRVLGRQHDIAEAQGDDFRPWVLASELVCESFTDRPGEGVSALRLALVLFGDGERRGRVWVEGDAYDSFLGREDDVPDTKLATSFKNVVSAHCVCAELAAAVCLARRRDCRQVYDGVDAAVDHVDCHESLEDGAHVFEVVFDESVGVAEAGLAVFACSGWAAIVD
jgi:hypothetical protein